MNNRRRSLDAVWRAVHPSRSVRQTVSILIPCFNERTTIREIVARAARQVIDAEREIIVVDDGSRDGSVEIIRELEHSGVVRAEYHAHNRGKGAALRTALALATGGITLVQDADLEYDPADYPALLAPVLRGEARAVYGSRWLTRHQEEGRRGRFIYVLGNWVLTRATNLLYSAAITDEACGYKVFDTTLLRSLDLRGDGFEFCPEVTAKLRNRGVRIHEVPVRYRGRSVAEGKKIRARDGVIALWTLVKHRLGK